MNASNGFDSLKMFFHEESVMDNDVKLDQDYHFNEINLNNKPSTSSASKHKIKDKTLKCKLNLTLYGIKIINFYIIY